MNINPALAHQYFTSVRRLLAEHGVETASSELAAHLGRDASLERVRSLFASRGKDARVVRVAIDDLDLLTLPTLVGLEGQLPCLLRHVGPRKVVLERGDRVMRMSRARLAQGMSGSALEILRPIDVQGHFVRRLGQALISQRAKLLSVSALTLVSSAVSFVGPSLTREVIDGALPDRAGSTLLMIVFALCGVALQRAVTGLLRDRASRGLELGLSRSMLKDTLSRLLAAPLAHQSQGTLGESMQVLASCDVVLGTVQALFSSTLFDLITTVAVLIAMYVWFPALVPLALSIVVTLLALSLVYGLRKQQFVKQVMQASERERTRLHELLSGVLTFKAFGAERSAVSRWLTELLSERSYSIRKDRDGLWLSAFMDLGKQVTTVGAFYWGGQAVLAGSISVGEVVAGLMLLDQLSEATRSAAGSIVQWVGVMPHVHRVESSTALHRPARRQAAQANREDPVAISLEDVWFRYGPTEPWLLRGYNLTVRAGEHLHLTGVSGAGKTTILRLIAGLYVPERGSVLVHGENPAHVQSALLYLPQAAHLFEGSLDQNLRNLSGASREEVRAAVAHTGLDEWLSTLPMQLDTVVPPGGTNLSGGQRQWVLLTAAVASPRRVLLLDEPTSQIDRVTRETLGFERLFAGRTVLYTAHDV